MAYSAGSVSLNVVPDMSGFYQSIRAKLAGTNAPKIKIKAEVDIDKSALSRFKELKGSAKGLEKLGDSSVSILRLTSSVTQLGAAVGTTMPLIAGLAGAVTQLAGAGLLLPGALLAGGAAMATLKLATSGFGDAIKNIGDPEKFAKAIKDMAPAAQQTAIAIRNLNPQFKALKKEVQGEFFRGFATDVKSLATTYLPILGENMSAIAARMNAMGREAVKALMTPASINDVNEVFNATIATLGNMKGALGNVLSGFLGLGAVGSQYLPALGTAIDNVALKFKTWVDQGVESGSIKRIIDNAILGFQQLKEIVGNLGEIIGGVFEAANVSGGGFLNTVAGITQKISDMVNSAQGQEALQNFFATTGVLADIVKQALDAILPILPTVTGLFLALATNIGSYLVPAVQFLAPILGQVAGFLRDHVNVIGPLVLIVAGLVGVLKVYSGIMTTVQAGLRLWAIAQAAVNLVMSLNPFAIVVIAIIALVAAIVIAYKNSETFRNIVQAVWNAVKSAISGAIDGIKSFIQSMIDKYNQARDGISAALKWISDKAGQAKDFVIRNVFEPLKSGVDAVGRAFQSVSDWIGRAWDAIKEKARAPVAFVVNTVYNNGIRRIWNGIAGVFGMSQLAEVHMAKGGVVPGRDYGYDTVPAMLRGGEGVLVPEATRMLGGTRGIDHLNRTAEREHFADGGTVGNVLSAGWEALSSLFTDGPVKWVEKLFGSVTGSLGGIPAAGQFTDALKKIPKMVIDKIIAKAKDMFSGAGSIAGVGAVGGGVQRWTPVVLQALAMMGQPASLLNVVLRRMNQESGGNPGIANNWDINARRGTPSMGLMQVIGPTFRAYHFPGTSNNITDPLANILASMRYALARYGSLPAAYNRPGGYDSGGWLPPGASQVYNGTGTPEAILTRPQWDTISSLASQAVTSGGTTINVYPQSTDVGGIAADLKRRLDFSGRAG